MLRGGPPESAARAPQVNPAGPESLASGFTGTVLLVGNYPPDAQQSMRRFAGLLVEGLQRHGQPTELLLPRVVLGALKPSPNGLGKWLGYFDKFVIFPIQLRQKVRQLRARGPVLVHICDHSNGHYSRYLRDTVHLVTCHDVLAIRSALGHFPEHRTAFMGRQYQRLIFAGLKCARFIACVSEATRDQLRFLMNGIGQTIEVVENGLNYPYFPMAPLEARAQVDALLIRGGHKAFVGREFLLHVGGNQWYKNRLGVLRLYAAFTQGKAHRPALILAGKPPTAGMKDFVLRHDLGRDVLMCTGFENEDLRALYSSARLFLFPSLAEGFGWPIVEAQACGCAVLTTAEAPMRDIAGEAAVCLELPSGGPEGWSQWAGKGASLIEAVLGESTQQRDSRRERSLANAGRFKEGRMIAEYLSLYRRLLGLPEASASPQKEDPMHGQAKASAP